MNKAEIDIVLAHVLRISGFRVRFWESFSENPFNELVDPVHKCVWDSIDRFRPDPPDGVIPRAALESDVPVRLAALPSGALHVQTLNDALTFYYDTPEDQLSDQVASYYLETMVMERAREMMRSRINDLCSQADFDALMKDAKAMAPTKDLKTSLVEPFSDVSRFLTAEVKEPTGVDVMDIISGGGFTTGTVNGLLGPTGGGKTMMTYQIATAQAKRGRHILVMTYEQGAEGDITHRICSGMMEVDIERVRPVFSEWTPDLVSRYEELRPLGEYIHIKDMTTRGQGTRGLSDLVDTYETLKQRGQTPLYIIVDWLLPMVKRYLVFNKMNVDGEMFRSVAGDFLDQLGQFVRDTGAIAVVNHQLDTQVSRASPKRKPVVTDAMEFKAFAFNLDACWLIGNRDKETNVAWLLSDKNRRGAPEDLLVRMNGDMARFEPAHGYVADHQGRFIREDAVMPDVLGQDDRQPRAPIIGGYL